MTIFPGNPGRLSDISRFVAPQPVIPGGSRFDYGAGAAGRPVPRVGEYASGSPDGGLGASLGDDTTDASGSALGYAVAGVGVLAALWMIGFFYTANTTIRTAPRLAKLIPFL
jgi:hypothetical protein